jgi:hypothetical protein
MDKLKEMYAENTILARYASNIDPKEVEALARKFVDLPVEECEAEFRKAQAGVTEKQHKVNLLNLLAGALAQQAALDEQAARIKAKCEENRLKVEGLAAKLNEQAAKKK